MFRVDEHNKENRDNKQRSKGGGEFTLFQGEQANQRQLSNHLSRYIDNRTTLWVSFQLKGIKITPKTRTHHRGQNKLEKASPQRAPCFKGSWIIVNKLVSISTLAQKKTKEEKNGNDGCNGTVYKENHVKENDLCKGLGVPKVGRFVQWA